MRCLLVVALVLIVTPPLLAELALSDISMLPVRYKSAIVTYSDINDLGFVSGGSGMGPFAWSAAGGFVDYPKGVSFTGTSSINNSNQICGHCWTDVAGIRVAYVSTNQSMTEIGSLLRGTSSYALDVNDAGQVVGYSNNQDRISNRAYLWDNGAVTEIVNGNAATWAHSINNSGAIAGVTQREGEYTHVFSWNSQSGLVEYSFDEWLGAIAVINNHNQILYRDHIIYSDKIIDLEAEYGSGIGLIDLNDNGIAVGHAPLGDGSYGSIWSAAVWTYDEGLIDLNDLLIDHSQWQRLDTVMAINNSNTILGQGVLTTGATAYFTAQIVPEPATFCLLGFGGISLLRRRQ